MPVPWRRRIAVVGAASALLSSCTGSSPEPSTPPPGDAESVRPYDQQGARSSPLPNGQYRFWPGSESAEVGVAYAFNIGVHCGIDFLVDFDRSFWEFVSGDQPENTNATPSVHGTMTLVDDDTAEFRSDEGLTVRFDRLDGPKDINLCS